jgi:hypothetical protein
VTVGASRVAIAVVVLICTAAAGWSAQVMWRSAARSQQARALEALMQQCSLQMVKDTCRVMNTPAPVQSTARLFIAGVGEVDAGSFAALRSYGDAMCREVGVQCSSDWEGRSCRIARALYPTAK